MIICGCCLPHRATTLPPLWQQHPKTDSGSNGGPVTGTAGRNRVLILAPLVRRKGEHQRIIEETRRNGFVRMRIDGQVRELSDEIRLEKNKRHTLEVVVDRLRIRSDIRKRLADSLELALGLSGGLVLASILEGDELTFSQNFACPDCGFSFEELSPRLFSLIARTGLSQVYRVGYYHGNRS